MTYSVQPEFKKKKSILCVCHYSFCKEIWTGSSKFSKNWNLAKKKSTGLSPHETQSVNESSSFYRIIQKIFSTVGKRMILLRCQWDERVRTRSSSLFLQHMCSLESELESQMGEFHVKMKGESRSALTSYLLFLQSTSHFFTLCWCFRSCWICTTVRWWSVRGRTL